jgi:septal ring factor EnvC (AmiA/AmiB activator)
MSNALIISAFTGAAGTVMALGARLLGKFKLSKDEGPAAKAAREAVQAVEGALTALREERKELRDTIKRQRKRIDEDQETIKAQREFIRSMETRDRESKETERTLLEKISELTVELQGSVRADPDPDPA